MSESAEQIVKAKWPDAALSEAFATQKDGSRKWMYCAMSSLKFIASRGKSRVTNIGSWKFSRRGAWEDAAKRIAGATDETK